MKKTIDTLLNKYTERMNDCQMQLDDDMLTLKSNPSTAKEEWLNDDIFAMNTQISIYECIIKDLKELKE